MAMESYRGDGMKILGTILLVSGLVVGAVGAFWSVSVETDRVIGSGEFAITMPDRVANLAQIATKATIMGWAQLLATAGAVLYAGGAIVAEIARRPVAAATPAVAAPAQTASEPYAGTAPEATAPAPEEALQGTVSSAPQSPSDDWLIPAIAVGGVIVMIIFVFVLTSGK